MLTNLIKSQIENVHTWSSLRPPSASRFEYLLLFYLFVNSFQKNTQIKPEFNNYIAYSFRTHPKRLFIYYLRNLFLFSSILKRSLEVFSHYDPNKSMMLSSYNVFLHLNPLLTRIFPWKLLATTDIGFS